MLYLVWKSHAATDPRLEGAVLPETAVSSVVEGRGILSRFTMEADEKVLY